PVGRFQQVQTHRRQMALRTHFVISNVPSTPNLLRGRQLEGKLILEVPAQVNPIPQSVLRAAQEENVIIRDTTGRIYK
ncbi:TPA: hypothetical protein ACFM8A_002039, partial [Neisseria meningitidis]